MADSSAVFNSPTSAPKPRGESSAAPTNKSPSPVQAAQANAADAHGADTHAPATYTLPPLGIGARSWAFGTSNGLRVQRQCACGGTCEHCQAEDESLRIQRQADDSVPQSTEASPSSTDVAADSAAATAPALGIIVADDQAATGAQMNRGAFMAQLRAELGPICDEELAPAGRSAEGCPYIVYWLDHASHLSAPRLERGIRRFTSTGAVTAQGLIDAVVSRVRAAVRLWVATGQVATPKALGTIDAASGFTAALVSSLGNALGGDDDGEATLQRKPQMGAAPAAGANQHSPTAVRSQLGAGRGLDTGVRSRMEQGFGRSFAGVRIHTDSNASNIAGGLAARAFTVGKSIAFRSGAYQPGSVAGDLLIAHELAHTIQQEGAVGNAAQPMQQERRLEADADRAAIGAVGSVLGLTEQMQPSGKSGLQLQSCQDVKYRCPPHYYWRVERTVGWGSAGCTCFWKCLPGDPPGYSPPSQQQTYRCPPEMNCSTGVRYETLGSDYEKKGYGAALTPLGEQAFCGCFPLNYEGEQVSDSPLKANDFELTDIVGPLADAAAARRGGTPQTDTTTGTRIPGKGGKSTPKPTGATKSPAQARYTTKPMMPRFSGEHLPGNPLWGGKTVKYLTDAERTGYKLQFKDGKIYDAAGKPFDTSNGSALSAGKGNAIFIMDAAGNFYASNYQAAGEFHHSSLAAGQPVAAAGEMRVVNGVLERMTDRSGHYFPTPDMRVQAVKALEANGVNVSGKVQSWDEK